MAHLEVALSRMAQRENSTQQDEETTVERESSNDQDTAHIPVIVNQTTSLASPAVSPVSSIDYDSPSYSPFPELDNETKPA